MRLKPRIGEIGYLAGCLALAGIASFTAGSNYLAFFLLFILTLPLSVFAYIVVYMGGLLLFGSEGGWAPSLYAFTVWCVIAVCQVVILRMILDARAERRASSA